MVLARVRIHPEALQCCCWVAHLGRASRCERKVKLLQLSSEKGMVYFNELERTLRSKEP